MGIKGKFFPVADYHPAMGKFKPLINYGITSSIIKAIATGEFREPKKGEYYLSGAIIAAYKAPNDLSTKYHIAKIVKVKEIVIEKIVEELPN